MAGLCHTPFSSVRWYDPEDTVIATPSLSGYRITPSASQGSTVAKRNAPGSPSSLLHTHTRALTARRAGSRVQQSARRSLPFPIRSGLFLVLYRHLRASSISTTASHRRQDAHPGFRRSGAYKVRFLEGIGPSPASAGCLQHRIGLKRWLYVGKVSGVFSSGLFYMDSLRGDRVLD